MKSLLAILLVWTIGVSHAQNPTLISSKSAITDLKESTRLLETVHYYPYLYVDSAEFHKAKNNIILRYEALDSVPLFDFILDTKRLVAKLNDGHTTISVMCAPLMEGLFLPFNVSLDSSKQFLIPYSQDYHDGLATINGYNAAELFQESMLLYGGNENSRKAIAETIFFPVFLYLKGIKPPYELTSKQGFKTTIEKGIDIQTISEKQRRPDDNYTFTILKGDIGYLAYNSCQNAKDFKAFLKMTFAEIESTGIDKLIIDIRENTGGNSSLNDLLIPYFSQEEYRQSGTRYWRVSDEFKEKLNDPIYVNGLGKSFVSQYQAKPINSVLKEDDYGLTKRKTPKHFFEGKSCMLIGPKTFSSANFLADAVSTYKLTTLIGSDTGENTNDFGEQISFTLPETGLTLRIAVAFDIGADGNAEKLEPVHPDIETKGDALEFAIEWIQTEE